MNKGVTTDNWHRKRGQLLHGSSAARNFAVRLGCNRTAPHIEGGDLKTVLYGNKD